VVFLGLIIPVSAQNPAASKRQQSATSNSADPSRSRGQRNLSAPSRRQIQQDLSPYQSIYENGPIAGTADLLINSGFEVIDSFTVANSSATVTGLTFGVWLNPGDVLQTAQVSISTTPQGGVLFNQPVNFTQNDCFTNVANMTVCSATGMFNGPTLTAGTYFLTLQNATVQNDDEVFWDENSGVGCQSPGCPSTAVAGPVGTIPSEVASESFSILGTPGNQTTTTLSVMPGTVTAGEVVTLSAVVTNSDQVVVTAGTVTFLSGTQVLGTVQANSGTPAVSATLKTRFGPGTYSLTAQYNANNILLGSVSQPVALTATGTEPTVSTLTATPDGSNYDFGLSVFGFGFPPLAGSAMLNDLTLGGTLVGTISVPGEGMSTLRPQIPYSTGSPPAGVAAADLNGDGILDLIITNYIFSDSNTFSVLLGNPDGSFQAPLTYSTGSGSVGVAVGDFNGDGNLDVAIANSGSGAVGVLLGNGQGGFSPEVDYPTGVGPVGVVVADFNGDGRADLAVTNYIGGKGTTVSVLLGNGDGTFQPAQTYISGRGPYGIVAADFNGDGLPDLAVVNNLDGTVSIFLNSGNGTFQLNNTYSVGSGPLEIVAADFKGVGIQDLAVTNSGSGTVSVLIGNGDGTFQQHVDYPSGSAPYGIVVADFNGDHIPDLAAVNETGNNLTVLIGDGQGGFAMQPSYPVGTQPLFLAAADFNGDGVPDLAVSNYDGGNGNTASVLLGGSVSTGTLNNTPVYGNGNQNVQASFAPNGAFYADSLSNIVQAIGSGFPTTTSLTSAPNPSTYLQTVTITATVTSIAGVGNPTGSVNFTDNGTAIPGCTGVALMAHGNDASVALCTTSSLAVGSHSDIVGAYPGNNNFGGSSGTLQPAQVVSKAASTISLASSPNPSTYLQTVTITATVTGANGGSPTGTVSFTDSGTAIPGCTGVALSAQRNGSAASCQATTLTVGSHAQIVGTYSGDSNYTGSNGTLNPAQVVNQAATTTMIGFSPPPPSMFGQLVTFTATVTGMNGGNPTGTVTFTDNNNPISGCIGLALTVQSGVSVATCQTSSLAVGLDTVAGAYSGDSNFVSSNGSTAYPVTPATTSAVLSVSPSNATAGQVVTLTATVTANGAPVPNGTVTFSSASATLGTVQIVMASGTATLKTRFAPGSYSLTARYNGTDTYFPCHSMSEPLTVTGTEPTISTLTETPDGRNYDFSLSVFGFGFTPLAGSATLNNITQGGTLLGNIQVPGAGTSSFQLAAFSTGRQPYLIATGDFNGDGFPDVAVADLSANTVSVLLGNGDGTFQPQQPYAVGLDPVGVVVADFNGDGIADLAVTNGGDNTVSVLLGNGDGTFQAQKTYAVGPAPFGIVVADFNGDGIPDLAVTSASSAGTISVLLGKGDGTFLPQQTYAAGTNTVGIAVADFNGDGIPDLAVTNESSGTVSVLLGNGDGSFQAPLPNGVGIEPYGMAVGDFNGDGFADLAVTNFHDATVSVLLGNGNGTFQSQQTYAVGNSPHNIVAADFNGDGHVDVAVTNGFDDTVSVLLGNGHGTFQPQQTYGAGSGPLGIAVADFNGDDVPDLAVVDNTASTVSILLGGTVSTGTLNNIPVYGSGGQNIQATFTPTGTFFAGGLSNMLTVTGSGAIPTSTVLTSSLNPSSYLHQVTFTATVTSVTGAPPTGTATFTADGNTICSAVPLVSGSNGSTATCLIATLTAGQHSIVASYSGGGNFASSQSQPLTQTVNKAATTVALTSTPNPSSYLQTVTITATVTGANGGSPTGTVSFTDSGTTISGCGSVALTAQQNGSVATCQTSTLAVGTHSQIVATYSGDGNYNGSNGTLQPAEVVNKAASTTVITANPHSPSMFGQMVTFTATVTGANGGSPTGTVSFTDGTNPISGCTGVALVPQTNGSTATCSTSTLTVGQHTVDAAYSGDNNFSLSSGPISYQVNEAGTAVSLSLNPTSASAGQVVTLTATVTANGGLVTVGTVTFLSGTQVLGTVQLVQSAGGRQPVAGTATLATRFGPGSYSLTAHYNGTNSFGPATSAPQPLTVTGTEPTISTLTATPDGSNYDFGLSVFGFGFPPLAGSATVNNLTQGGTLIGNITLPGPGMLDLQSANVYPVGNFSIAVATGDFNGDGFIDLAVVNQTDNTVSILLGNGDGTFRTQQTYPLATGAGGIAVGDFNGDGKLDLAVACAGGSNGGVVSVLLGNGDGTFQAQQTYAVGFFAFAVAVGDFNLDGSPDLVASGSSNTGGAVVVLLNNGDGTFTAQQTSPAGMSGQAVAVGDFNKDGRLDVAVADFSGNQAVVLLGNGQGGFGRAQTYPAGTFPSDIVIGDLNHDGNLDLALTNQGDNTVSVLLGNSDGTFQAQHAFAAGQMPVGIGITEFTGSGFQDLAVASSGDNTVRVLLGNGDGTFQPQLTFPSGGASFGLAIADFNGDGFPDVATANYTSNDASVLVGGTVSSGQLLNAHVTGNGNQNVQSNFAPGGTVYAPSLSNVVTVAGSSQMPTTTVLVSSQNPSRLGQPVTFTATVTSSPLPPSGNVTFTSNGMTISECPNPVPLMLVGTLMKASCTTQSLPAGADTISASFNDPQRVFGSSSASLTQTVQTGAGDFQISLNTPGTITLTQSYSNATDPFFSQTVQVTVQAVNGYSGTVTLSCGVSPPLSGGSCVVNAPISGMVDANLVTTLTISAGSGTPIGQYTITVSGQDQNGLMHQTNQPLMVIDHASGITEPTGGGGSTMVYFPGLPGSPIGNFTCPMVSGTGLTGNQPLSTIGGNCTFSPTSGTIPGPIMVTIYGCTVARLRTHMPIYAMLFFGLPGVVLLGPLAVGRSRRKRLLQVIGIFLVVCAMLLAVGCGGYGQLTPTGNYQVLVQGTSPDGTVYSAVVPVTVTPLH